MGAGAARIHQSRSKSAVKYHSIPVSDLGSKSWRRKCSLDPRPALLQERHSRPQRDCLDDKRNANRAWLVARKGPFQRGSNVVDLARVAKQPVRTVRSLQIVFGSFKFVAKIFSI